MHIPDPIERGEAACELWAADNIRIVDGVDIATCSCGGEFRLVDGQSTSHDPYAIPVCPQCFQKGRIEWNH